MNLLWIVAVVFTQITEVQTDWLSGPGVLGPVPSWGSAFYESSNITFNIPGQVSPIAVAATVDYNGWVRHNIDVNSNIKHHNSILPADFDGDGDLDLAGFLGISGEVRIYRNQKVETGTPNFTIQTTLTGIDPAGATGYADQWGIIWCGDMDGDGDPDIVVPGDGLWWFENTGGFNFTLHSISDAQTYNYRCCTAGDIDNDGDTDIIAAGNFIATTDLYRNNNGIFQLENIGDGAWWRVDLGYLNDDDYLDLLAVEDIYLNDGGDLEGPPDYTFPEWHDGQAIRDFNNDGKEDIMLAMYYAWIRWYENDGTGTNYTLHTINSNPVGYADAAWPTDIDMDGKTDVVSCYMRVGFFKQITLDNFTEYVVEPSYNDAHWLTVANLDYAPCQGDADEDILASGEGMFTWWENRMMKGFVSDAYLISSILDAGGPSTWHWFGWEVCRASGTTLNFFLRAGKEVSEVQSNPWKGPFPAQEEQPEDSTDISTLFIDGERYFQYKIEMAGADSCPAVYEVWVRFSPEYRKDIGICEIVTPDECLYNSVPINPCCYVNNFGTALVITPVYCRVSEMDGDEVWSDVVDNVTIEPGDEELVCFGEFTPECDIVGKSYSFLFEVPLDGDFNPKNNEKEKIVPCCTIPPKHDLATICIFYPDTLCRPDTLYPDTCWVPANTNIKPQARYKNVGDFPESTYFLCAAIDSIDTIVYADSIDQNPFGILQPNDTADVITQFKDWYTGEPTETPIYTLIYFTLLLPEDCYHKNDTLRIPFGVKLIGVQEPQVIPKTFSFEVKGPTPSVHTTAISYSLPRTTKVCLKVYDVTGKVVNTLVNDIQSAGSYSLSWQGNNEKRKRLPSGIYFISLETEEYKATKKVVLLTK